MFTIRASQLSYRFTTEYRVQEVLEWSGLDGCLQSIEYHVQELLGILLYCDVNGGTSEILQGKAEVSRVVIESIAQLQECEHLLELVEHIVVNRLAIFRSWLQIRSHTIFSH